MGSRTHYLHSSQKYPAPLVGAAWTAAGGRAREDCVLFGGGGQAGPLRSQNALIFSSYDKGTAELSNELYRLSLKGTNIQAFAIHPAGDGLVASFATGCKHFKVPAGGGQESGEKSVVESEWRLEGLQGVGPQRVLVFSPDGSRLAAAGEDKRVRVFAWPAMTLLLDVPPDGAHASSAPLADADFSLDGGLLATSAPAGPVRVWDVSKAALAPPAPASGPAPAPAPVPVGTLLLNAPSSSRAGPRPTGEQEAAGAGATGAKTPGVAAPLPASFGFCKFTRDEKKPLLFTTVTRGGKGFIVVWNMATWGLIGVRRIYHQPITCFAASRSGRMLATGNARGDVSVLDIKTMSMRQRVSAAHLGPVSALSFHPSSRYLLSVSRDGTARVTALKRYSDDLAVWQIYLLIFLFAALTVAVAFGFNYYGQWFWRMPLGNEQRMYRNPEYLVARS